MFWMTVYLCAELNGSLDCVRIQRQGPPVEARTCYLQLLFPETLIDKFKEENPKYEHYEPIIEGCERTQVGQTS